MIASLQAEMTRNFESMAVIVIESLQATPPAYSARFDAACRHSLSNLKPTRLQVRLAPRMCVYVCVW